MTPPGRGKLRISTEPALISCLDSGSALHEPHSHHFSGQHMDKIYEDTFLGFIATVVSAIDTLLDKTCSEICEGSACGMILVKLLHACINALEWSPKIT